MAWTIKQATEKTGIPADTLRYYDKEGIISPKRRENGYRYYDENDITALKNIVVMKYAHFSLAEMRSMEELYNSGPGTPCSEVCKSVLSAKLTELNRAIQNYQKIVSLLEELLLMVACGTGRLSISAVWMSATSLNIQSNSGILWNRANLVRALYPVPSGAVCQGGF